MSSTKFIDGQTVISATWLNEINRKAYVENASVFDFMTIEQITDVQMGTKSLDVTKAIQNAINAFANGGRLYFPMGVYRITSPLVKVSSFSGPSFIGQGSSSTTIYYAGASLGPSSNRSCFYIQGGSGGISDIRFEGLGFVGDSATIAIEIDGQDGVNIRDCKFGSNAVGILFNNHTSGAFTEYCVAENCDFSSSCLSAVEYSVSGGNTSFHGSGVKSCTVNTTGVQPVIKIGANAQPYNAPLSFQVWNSNSATVISNNSKLAISFYGNLTWERFNGLLTLAGGNQVAYCGTVLGSNENVTGGTLLVCRKIVTLSNGGTLAVDTNKASQFNLSSGANTLITGLGQYARMVRVQLIAANYDYRFLIFIEHDGFGNAGYVSIIAHSRAFNQSGFGPPTFSVNTTGDLIVTNPYFPSKGVTASLYEQTTTGGIFGDAWLNI